MTAMTAAITSDSRTWLPMSQQAARTVSERRSAKWSRKSPKRDSFPWARATIPSNASERPPAATRTIAQRNNARTRRKAARRLRTSARIVTAFGESGLRRARGVNHRLSLSRHGCTADFRVTSEVCSAENCHCKLQRSPLIDNHGAADVCHRVEFRDVVIAEPHAAVGHRLSELFRLVGAVDSVAVAELQAVLAEDLVEVALLGVDGRDHDRITGDDHLPRRQFAFGSSVLFDDGVALHLEHRVAAVAGEP